MWIFEVLKSVIFHSIQTKFHNFIHLGIFSLVMCITTATDSESSFSLIQTVTLFVRICEFLE